MALDIDKILVLDTETSLKNDDVGKFKAHPIHPDNWVVWLGAKEISLDFKIESPVWMLKYATKDKFKCKPTFNVGKTLLVGHNIGFDLLHLANTSNADSAIWRDLINNPDSIIWDTQLAAYRLSGQTMISPSMDQVAEKYGLSSKPGKMKEYWEQGIGTEDIPDDEVKPYLEHDVITTGEIFKRQLVEAQKEGMLDVMLIEMKSRMTTLVMELNGMYFDAEQARADCAAVLKPMREKYELNATTKGMKLFGLPCAAVRPNSPHFLKAVLYGGTVKWREQHPMLDPVTGDQVYFKSGKKKGETKLQWKDFQREVKGVSPVKFPGTDDETLVKIIQHTKCDPELASFLEDVRGYRDGQKQEQTYFTGYSDLTWHDGMIHGNLNHAITATGRLSSSNPNLQNAGHSPIRNHFRSRFKDGMLMEVDLSQIEVVVQAFLSQDMDMIHDIIEGVDFHSKRAAFAHGVDYALVKEAVDDELHPDHAHWTKIRKGAKIVSFQKAYGAGVNKIADTTGLSKGEVKAFMQAEDANYPKVPLTQEAWIREVERSTGIRDGKTSGVLKSPINVQYRFFQDDFNGHKQYKPTCIKNYPIQGFSADILKIILSDLRRVVKDFNEKHGVNVLIVNTVHDSVIFDVPDAVDLKELGRLLRDHFIETPISVLKNTFGVEFNAPISADVDVGSDWHNMKPINVN